MVNPNVGTIGDLSSLTNVQVETLKIHLLVVKGEINMDIALKTRRNSGVSRGTHYRILAQARKNIRESLFTVATVVQLGLVKPEDVQKLIVMMSSIPLDADRDKLEEAMVVAKALADRIVMQR